MNYYQILDISISASADEIKAAYRKKSKETHPDLNKDDVEAESKFKKISEAYETLSDPIKKSIYDKKFNSNNSFFDDVFSNIFNSKKPNKPRGDDIGVLISLEIDDIIVGCQKTFKINRRGRCGTCKSQGGKFTTCPKCNGKGGTIHHGGGLMFQRSCPECVGEGYIITDRCLDCLGTGLSPASEIEITINIESGNFNGSMIIPDQGHPGKYGGPNGNLVVHLKTKPHRFYRQSSSINLLAIVPVTFSQLMKGADLKLPPLGGEEISVSIPPNSSSNAKFVINQKGLPLAGTSLRGEIIVSLNVVCPKNTNKQYINLINKLEKLEKEVEFKEIVEFNEMLTNIKT